MSATRIWSKFKELLDVSWGSVSDGYLLKRSGANIIGVPASSVGQVWRGEYNPATTYQPNDAVSYTGSSYLCGATTTGVAPVPSTASYLIPPLATTGSMGSIAALPVANQALSYARGDNTWSDLAAAVKPTIWSVRQRNYNAMGNANFEVDQIHVGAVLPNVANGNVTVDRWYYGKAGTMAISTQQIDAPANLVVPGSTMQVTNKLLRTTLTTAQASLAAGEYMMLTQNIEGPTLRELFNDVTSLSILARSSVANLKFSVAINDFNGAAVTRSITYLCSLGAANTFSLLTFPNIPVMPSAGQWVKTPGAIGGAISVCLGSGTTYVSPGTGAWQNGNFPGASGMSNFAASAVNSTFDLAFVQLEPGAECSGLIDVPFRDSLYDCQRYCIKSYNYATALGSGTYLGAQTWIGLANTQPYGFTPLTRTMATTPTPSVWSPVTGAYNCVRDLSATADRAVSGFGHQGEGSAFGTMSLSAGNPAGTWLCSFQYLANTPF